nr:MAG TPA: hypothetical protein [Caudoviricetes sp.]
MLGYWSPPVSRLRTRQTTNDDWTTAHTTAP